jgi:hypothetical protein
MIEFCNIDDARVIAQYRAGKGMTCADMTIESLEYVEIVTKEKTRLALARIQQDSKL